MGATQSKDGTERSVLSRLLDPNGVLLEETEGWESGNFAAQVSELRAAQSIENDLVRTKSGSIDLALNLGEFDKRDHLSSLTEDRAPPKESIVHSTSLVDVGMSRIAIPSVARWLANDATMTRNDSASSSGEEIFMHRRSKSKEGGVNEDVLTSLHRRARSLTGLPLDFEDSFRKNNV